jgi:DNA-directed RNA polymerase specialized sigma24 family protein
VAQLPFLDREVLLMRIVERLSCEEIAYVLGIEASAAKRHLSRAFLRLHQILGEQPT